MSIKDFFPKIIIRNSFNAVRGIDKKNLINLKKDLKILKKLIQFKYKIFFLFVFFLFRFFLPKTSFVLMKM